MKITITVEMDNASFEDNGIVDELRVVLLPVPRKVMELVENPAGWHSFSLLDSYGNTVGGVEVER